MKKTLCAILAGIMCAAAFSACAQANPKPEASSSATEPAAEAPSAAAPAQDPNAAANSGKLVIYTASNEEILSTLIPMFEEQTGIKTEVLTGGAGEMLKRIQTESGNPYCDVMLGGTETVFMNYLDQFQEYVSANDSAMLEGYGNFNGLTPINLDSSIIMWNKNLIGDVKVESYNDMLKPELKGKIAFPDPAASGTGVRTLQDLLYVYDDGTPENKAGWDAVTQFVTNLDGKIASSSGNAHKSVADGENTITITYEGAAFAYLKNGADVGIAYPSEGVDYARALMGIVKGAQNLENAKKFVDFVTSKDVQDLFGTVFMSRPVRKDAKLAEFISSMDTVKTYVRDTSKIAATNEAVIEKYNEIYADSLS